MGRHFGGHGLSSPPLLTALYKNIGNNSSSRQFSVSGGASPLPRLERDEERPLRPGLLTKRGRTVNIWGYITHTHTHAHTAFPLAWAPREESRACVTGVQGPLWQLSWAPGGCRAVVTAVGPWGWGGGGGPAVISFFFVSLPQSHRSSSRTAWR